MIFVRNSQAKNVRVLREELLHTHQQKPGFAITHLTQAEIDVREKMISNGSKWGISPEEIEEIKNEVSVIKSRGRY